jgi:type II secretory pathway component PulK
MNPPCVIVRGRPRSGVAVLWALLVLTLLGVTTAAATWQIAAARRALEGRQNRLQTLWLARSGVELAVARLLADPNGYAGEVVAPVPESEVRITVQKDPARTDTYQIRSEARYPASGPGSIGQLLTRTATRRTDGQRVRVELATP